MRLKISSIKSFNAKQKRNIAKVNDMSKSIVLSDKLMKECPPMEEPVMKQKRAM